MLRIRNANYSDLKALVQLETRWPASTRASKAELARRLQYFPEGYFIIEDNTHMLASIILHPYAYNPHDLSNLRTWKAVVQQCYQTKALSSSTNALYVVSATSRPNQYGAQLFPIAMQTIAALATDMNKPYILAGIRLPRYARFLSKNQGVSAADYAFTTFRGRYVDPFIEQCKRIGLLVPSKNHVIANYFPDQTSLNYSALVVKTPKGS